MKRITNRKFRLKYYLKLYDKDGGLISSHFKTIKSKIVDLSRLTPWHKAYIKVDYGDDMSNDGDYFTQEKFEIALNNFTEKKLLDFIEG
jgi:hypothetical protein